MSAETDLNTIKEFLEETVKPQIKLQKASDNNVKDYSLMQPNVFVGWVPPKGYLPAGMESIIPCLIVGLDEASDDGESDDLNLRITAAVYSPGEHKPVGDNVEFTPDFQGYKDLLNLLERTKAEFLKNSIIKNALKVQKPVKRGMYEEQPYPYWYGWVKVTVSKSAYPQTDVAKLL
ncbi:MAG: hypothetical protein ACM3TR_11510 [Caulobacteraceae bacterium]